MKIYVLRHGRTDCNSAAVYNGLTDESLNETGILQAEKASDSVELDDIDLIICSPLRRAVQTAEIVNKKGLPMTIDERLIERDFNELTGVRLDCVDRFELWNYYSEKYNAESLPHLVGRVGSLIEECKVKYPDKKILFVTHNGVARAAYVYINGVPGDGDIRNCGNMNNCEIKEYSIE